MLKNIKKTHLIITCFIIFICLSAESLAAVFDPNYIISDEEILDSNSMTLSEIDAFLRAKNGYISKNSLSDYAGRTKTAAQIIYNAANNYDCGNSDIFTHANIQEKERFCQKITINPKFLIVLLQKEQSLITATNPTQRQLNWATGYGCPDGGGCNDRWEGFGKQVNSASLQFFDYMKNPHHYTYRAGNTYTISNTGKPEMEVTPLNKATAALYNYTPHVYNGNYNFYKLWMRYFTFSYPDNTLLQIKGEPGVWLIKNGEKRPFLTKGALTSRYDLNKVIQVNKSILDQYPKGAPIKFPQYSLIRSPRGTIYLLVNDKRRGFENAEAFRKIGFNPEELLDASWEDINAYEEGVPITATSSYPTGALLQDRVSGGIYYVTEGTKAPLWDAVLLTTKFKWKSITPESPEKLASFKTVEPAIFNDGELLKSNLSPAVYIIDNKKRRPITSGKIFEDLGYSWDNIITVPEKILNLYAEGDAIKEIFTEDIISIDNATSTESILASSTPNIASGTDETLEDEINNILNP